MVSASIEQCEGRARHAAAWVGLCLALAIHVADEALTDFLSVYNPAVRAIRERLPFLPLPTFEFETWLAGLIVAVIVLTSLSVFALRGARWMIPASYVFAVVMFVNGLVHVAGSVETGRAMPGVYSAPLLLLTAGYLIACTRERQRRSTS
ncbi:MAG TPA: HXXEE domain-containing protein [Blastocatellia bacterium]|nr:HXXEE domain-containing protein [Blastocatellia bacterium]